VRPSGHQCFPAQLEQDPVELVHQIVL
jgi:hypothetical protein